MTTLLGPMAGQRFEMESTQRSELCPSRCLRPEVREETKVIIPSSRAYSHCPSNGPLFLKEVPQARDELCHTDFGEHLKT